MFVVLHPNLPVKHVKFNEARHSTAYWCVLKTSLFAEGRPMKVGGTLGAQKEMQNGDPQSLRGIWPRRFGGYAPGSSFCARSAPPNFVGHLSAKRDTFRTQGYERAVVNDLTHLPRTGE